MSQLLDSLRRASGVAPARKRPAKRPPPAAILATMGYSVAARERSGRRISLLVLSGAVFVAVTWSAFVGGSRASNHEGLKVSESNPERSTAPVHSRGSEDRRVTSPGSRDASIEKGDPVPARLPAASSGRPLSSVVAAARADERDPRPLLPLARRQRTADSSAPAIRFRAAMELQRTGQLDAAVRLYQELIAVDELAAASHNNLGLIQRQRGDPVEAIRQFERALVRDPDYARAHNNLGVVLLGQGRIDAAVERFSRAARLDPRDPDALVNLALAQKAGGGIAEAKESLLRALGLAPDSAPAHYNLAVIYDRSGEARRAVEHYRAFLDHSRAEHASRAADVRARLDVLDRSR